MSEFNLTFGDPLIVHVAAPDSVTKIVISTPEQRPIVVAPITAEGGTQGAPGEGVSPGGTTGQSLVKTSNADYDTTWADRLASVSEDVSPALGGDLQANGYVINFQNEFSDPAGSLGYDVDEQTISYTNASGVTIEFGEKNVFYGKAAEPISKGDVVMFGGVQGNHLLLKKADQQAVGFIPEWVVGFAAQALDTNDFGYVVWFGKLDGLSGYDPSTYSEGDLLYLDPTTAGGVTTTEPLPAAGHSILLAAVLTTSAGSSGRIIIRPTHKQDTDEVPEGSTNLYFTDARAQAAVNTFESSNITFSDATRSADIPEGGRLTFRDSSDLNILYLDEATRSLGVKTAGAPTATLDVSGDAKISSNLTVSGNTVTLADASVIGVADTERFTIGPISGSANLDVTANTEFSQITGFAAGIKINGGGSNNITIESPTLASGYTITLPADGGTNGYVLSTNGSGTTSWVEQSGGVDTFGTPIANQISVFTDADTIEGDTNLTWNGSLLRVTGALRPDEMEVNGRTPSSSLAGEVGAGSRVITQLHTSGAVTAGKLYVSSSASWTEADADTAQTSIGLLAVATDDASPARMLLEGSVRMSSNTGFSTASKGDVLYISQTAGEVTDDISSYTTGDFVRICGYVLNASENYIFFKPDNTWLEL